MGAKRVVAQAARRRKRKSKTTDWDALAEIEVFVKEAGRTIDEVEAALEGKARCGRKPDLDRDRLLELIWLMAFAGLQWRVVGHLSGVPFTAVYGRFARWTRIGVWRALGRRMMSDLRKACGDGETPSAAPADSRSLRSSPTCWTRGIDGGKKVKGVKLHAIVDKHGSVLDLEATAANVDDRTAAMPMLERLAEEIGFAGTILGDLNYQGERFGDAAAAHGIIARRLNRQGTKAFCPG